MLEKIEQETHYLIGTKQALSDLENKDHARLLVISDSHNRYVTFKNIVLQYGKEAHAAFFYLRSFFYLSFLCLRCTLCH